MDFVQWTGPSTQQNSANFQTINYKHDVYVRRIEKKVDGFSTRYLYDGDQVIAEYDGNNNLLRKYIYGPGIDQPVCMIEEAESETYYYHFDTLGSVVALSDSSGDTVQTYEYSIFGQVAASDNDFPNPYMFAGRRYDIEIGLYYYRARYYNPYTGRFLQTDPIRYEAGMNLYSYCVNNPLNFVDPLGLDSCPVCGNPDGWCCHIYLAGSDPCWTEVTGSIMILPWRLDPRELSLTEELGDYLALVRDAMGISGRVGVIIDLWKGKNRKALKDLLDPTSALVGAYLDCMVALADLIPNIARNDTNLWRAFFEEQCYRWKKDENGEYVLDDDGYKIKEKVGKALWVEVINLKGFVGLGYLKREDAYSAAILGRRFWYCYQLKRPVPEAWFSGTSVSGDIYGSTYMWEGLEIPTFSDLFYE